MFTDLIGRRGVSLMIFWQVSHRPLDNDVPSDVGDIARPSGLSQSSSHESRVHEIETLRHEFECFLWLVEIGDLRVTQELASDPFETQDSDILTLWSELLCPKLGREQPSYLRDEVVRSIVLLHEDGTNIDSGHLDAVKHGTRRVAIGEPENLESSRQALTPIFPCHRRSRVCGQDWQQNQG